MFEFIKFCVIIAVIVAIGGFVLNILFMVACLAIGGVCAFFGWIGELFTKKKEAKEE